MAERLGTMQVLVLTEEASTVKGKIFIIQCVSYKNKIWIQLTGDIILQREISQYIFNLC